MKFFLQTKAPAGNWVDSLGTSIAKHAFSHGEYLSKMGNKTRVVRRKDTPIYPRKKK